MTPEELKELGPQIAHRAGKVGWQTYMAKRLKISLRQFQRYVAGESNIPEPTAELIRLWAVHAPE